MDKVVWDVIIIGGGPAGLTAAINTAARGLKTLVLEARCYPGGQPLNIYPKKKIQDYPGFPEGIYGEEFGKGLWAQAGNSGAVIKTQEFASEFDFSREIKAVKTNNGAYEGKYVILATGLLNIPRKLKAVEEFKGDGKYYNIGNPEQFRGKSVLIAGGGDTAFDNALMLEKYAKEIIIINRSENLRAKEKTVQQVKAKGIKIMLNTELKEITGSGKIEGVTLIDNKTKKEDAVKADAVVVSAGYLSSTDSFKKAGIKLDKKGSIKVNSRMQTNIENVFAAGDVTGGINLIAVACSDGIRAAINTYYSTKPLWLK